MSVLALANPCQTLLQGQICLLLEQVSKITFSLTDLMLHSRLSERR
jgi:hypothetical protein